VRLGQVCRVRKNMFLKKESTLAEEWEKHFSLSSPPWLAQGQWGTNKVHQCTIHPHWCTGGSWFTPALLGNYCSLKLEFQFGWTKECNWSNPSLTTPYCPHKFLKKFEEHCYKRIDGQLMDKNNSFMLFSCFQVKCSFTKLYLKKEMQKWRYRKCYPRTGFIPT
jgi:hypothetical protein